MYKDSRYNKETVTPHVFRGEARRFLTFRLPERSIPPGSIMHTVKNTDTFDILAFRYLGSGDYWWVIADLNPHVEPWCLGEAVGESIWIPPKYWAFGRVQSSGRTVVKLSATLPSLYMLGGENG